MHLEVEALEALLHSDQAPALRHLLECPRCRRNLGACFVPGAVTQGLPTDPLGSFEPGEVPPLPWEAAVLFRAIDVLQTPDRPTDLERTAARGLLADLLSYPPENRQDVLNGQPRFRSRALADLLLEAAGRASAGDPSHARHLALLAVAVLEKIEVSSRVQRGLAHAYCLLAESERRRGHFDISDDLLANGVRELANEPLVLEVRARLCRTLGSLRQDQHRVDEAIALFDRARTLAQTLGADSEHAQAALALGWLLLEENDAEAAISPLREAYHLSDDQDPYQVLSALHGVALAFADCGYEDALAEISSVLEAMPDRLPQKLDAIRVDWIQAQVVWRQGDKEKAISALEDVFQRLLQEDPGIPAATAGLELAQRHLEHRSPEKALTEIADALARLSPRCLPANLAEVADFALRLPLTAAKGFFVDTLQSASDYIQRAQFDASLPFFPLTDPDIILPWGNLDRKQQKRAASAAGIELGLTGPKTAEDFRRIAWTHEALHGVRILIPDLHDAQDDETWPS